MLAIFRESTAADETSIGCTSIAVALSDYSDPRTEAGEITFTRKRPGVRRRRSGRGAVPTVVPAAVEPVAGAAADNSLRCWPLRHSVIGFSRWNKEPVDAGAVANGRDQFSPCSDKRRRPEDRPRPPFPQPAFGPSSHATVVSPLPAWQPWPQHYCLHPRFAGVTDANSTPVTSRLRVPAGRSASQAVAAAQGPAAATRMPGRVESRGGSGCNLSPAALDIEPAGHSGISTNQPPAAPRHTTINAPYDRPSTCCCKPSTCEWMRRTSTTIFLIST